MSLNEPCSVPAPLERRMRMNPAGEHVATAIG